MKFIKTLKIDINKNNFETIPSVQYDSNTRYLHVYLLNNSLPFDITGCSVKIAGMKADNTEIFNNCKIIDYKKGFVEIELTEQMNAAAGSMECELKIYSVDGVLTTKTFIINISKSITRAASITSTSEYNALTDALNKVQGIDNKFEEFGSQLEQINSQLDTKLNKNGIIHMDNMGQDVKEKFTGGSVAVVERDGVLTETVVDNQITVEKTSFADYEGQTQIYNGEYTSDKYLNLNSGTGYLDVSSITSGNTGYYCEIPIKNNSYIRIRARGINRCRIAIAYQADIVNGVVTKGSEIIVNDDSLINYDGEFETKTGVYLLLYLGSNLESLPMLEVLQRDIGSKIKFSSNLNLSEKDLNFIKENPLKVIANNFTISKINDTQYGLYRKDNLTTEELEEKIYVTLFINVENSKSVNIKFKGNRGLLLSSKTLYPSDYLGKYFTNNSNLFSDGSRFITYDSNRVTVINNSNSYGEYEYNYLNEGEDKTLILYISMGRADYYVNIDGFIDIDNSIIGDNIKIVANKISENAPLNGKNLIEGSVDKKALSFEIGDFISNSNNSVSIPFWEVPTQPNTWATTSSGKDLNINSEQFMDLFFNPYVDKSYDDGYKVTKTLLGKDQSNTYNIYEYVFEPKNYTRTIIITSGNHPYELPAHFGFGRFIHYVMNEPDIHEGIRYIRDNVRIVTIPVLNPWGFSQNPKVYGNCNLVNINRNFDSNGRWAKFPTGEGNEWNYKGTSPFSEKETQILRDFYIKYKDVAEWAIDCHCGVNNEMCDAWIVALTNENILLPKLYKAINMFDERCRNILKREPKNNIQLDMASSIRCWYSLEQLGLPNISVEYRPQRYGGDMNGSTDLTYYLMYLSNYVFQALSYSSDEIRHNQILLNRKIDLLLSKIN